MRDENRQLTYDVYIFCTVSLTSLLHTAASSQIPLHSNRAKFKFKQTARGEGVRQ